MNFVMSADGKIIPKEGNNDKTRDAEIVGFQSLLEEDGIDELFLNIVPVILGGGKSATLTGLPGDFLPEDRPFQLKEMREVEEGVLLHYRRNRKR